MSKSQKNRLWSNIGKHHHGKNPQKISQCATLNGFFPNFLTCVHLVVKELNSVLAKWGKSCKILPKNLIKSFTKNSGHPRRAWGA